MAAAVEIGRAVIGKFLPCSLDQRHRGIQVGSYPYDLSLQDEPEADQQNAHADSRFHRTPRPALSFDNQCTWPEHLEDLLVARSTISSRLAASGILRIIANGTTTTSVMVVSDVCHPFISC